VFASRLELAERYAALLADDGVLRGLIGPREAPRLWQRHLLNCAVLADALPEGSDVADIGSGAGLPGLVLAIRRPDLRITLVEPLLRRTTFLSEAVDRLGLASVEVVRARAEELHGRREFAVVTSRAVAPLPRLLDWSMPLVRQGGALVAMKGSTAQAEVEAATADLVRHGAGAVTVTTYGQGVVDPPTTVVRVEATRPSRIGWDVASRPARDARPGSRRRKGRRS
jgi:16S rRNA (guanine527-N7)-methyltransferase